jgi:hypothetical protein
MVSDFSSEPADLNNTCPAAHGLAFKQTLEKYLPVLDRCGYSSVSINDPQPSRAMNWEISRCVRGQLEGRLPLGFLKGTVG